jgi:monoamine oxidase
MHPNNQVLIVGGGLSGLCLAYYLHKEKVPVTVLEAASRLGGRIQTQIGEVETPLELGATWFSKAHTELLFLIETLGLERFPQFSEGK